MKKLLKETSEKVDIDEILCQFKVPQSKNGTFQNYLKEIWKDLTERSNEKHLGIDKVTFAKYFDLPGLINDRLFSVFDQDGNSFISKNEFLKGMLTLYTGDYNEMIKFIFSFYDFDKDNKITKEDIRVVLSYIPLKISKQESLSSFKFEKEDYLDRVESQEELSNLLSKLFMDESTLKIDAFKNYVEKISSESFIYILIFLLEKKPFSFHSVFCYRTDQFDEAKSMKSENKSEISCSNQDFPSPIKKESKFLIAEPALESKFSPSKTLADSPSMQKKKLSLMNVNANKKQQEFLINLVGVQPKNMEEKLDDKAFISPSKDFRAVNKKANTTFNLNIIGSDMKKLTIDEVNEYKPEITSALESEMIEEELKQGIIIFSGSLFKITHTKSFKKMTYRLINKDMLYFKDCKSKFHKGLHYLCDVFLKENPDKLIDKKAYKSFSIIFPTKTRTYYVDTYEEYAKWINVLKTVTKYSELHENYSLQNELGSGKFGLVKLGKNKKNQRLVAVKTLNKKEMSHSDFDLVKNEIEIMKVSQHPNLIKLYDIIENEEEIHIVMEYCEGGDLFGFLEKRDFVLKEDQAAVIIYKIASAIFYLHSYGVAHRDLKPENILMTDMSNSADIKLMDFGLGKIIGPKEKCKECFGTISYVAPEVLKGEPYDKQVDLFSIGVIMYLCLSGSLPFDDENSDKEIARQTIFEEPSFPDKIWKKLSSDAKDCVVKLLEKNPEKRMKITDLLHHPWLQKVKKTLSQSKHRKGNSITIQSSDKNIEILKSFV